MKLQQGYLTEKQGSWIGHQSRTVRSADITEHEVRHGQKLLET